MPSMTETIEPDPRQPRLTALEAAQAEVAAENSAARMRDFHNRLRILRSIDEHELREAGVVQYLSDWTTFARDPYVWFIKAPDADAMKVWAILERRAGPR